MLIETSIERTPGTIAAYAVADAMMFAYSLQVAQWDAKSGPHDIASPFSEETVADQTFGKCLDGSLAAIAYLSTNFPTVFDKMIIISGSGEFDHPNGYERHYGFLARAPQPDGSFCYFYGSPGNYVIGKRENDNTLTRMLIDNSLEGILEQIKHYETGGEWPSLENVTEAMEQAVFPQVFGRGKFAQVMCTQIQKPQIGETRTSIEYRHSFYADDVFGILPLTDSEYLTLISQTASSFLQD